MAASWMKSRGRGAAGAILFTALFAMMPPSVVGQSGDGYMFRQPKVTLKFETGYGIQRASGEIFDFVIDSLTLGRRDFDSPYVGAEVAVRLNERLDVALSIGYQGSSQESEFRLWDEDGLPINQVTELRQIPVVASVKYYPMDRGRTLGRFAWVPRRISPFVGAGIGAIGYAFRQHGDFVDSESAEIFTDAFESEDSALLTRLSGGANVSIGSQFLLTLEGRYSWADGTMQDDYIGFDPIDLDGFQFIGGLAVRF